MIHPARTAAGQRTSAPLSTGDTLPRLLSDARLTAHDREYLGERTKRQFDLATVTADAVVIVFMNTHCPSCIAQAAVLNALFERITADPKLRVAVKCIGIGAGNTRSEVQKFRAARSLSFPVIPDPEFILYDAVGRPGTTPYTLIAKNTVSEAVIARIYSGFIDTEKPLLDDVRFALKSDMLLLKNSAAAPHSRKECDRVLRLPVSGEKLVYLARDSMNASLPEGSVLKAFKQIDYAGDYHVFSGLADMRGRELAFYTAVISEKPVCDTGHGIHFIVTFDEKGVIADFTPVHLTKYGNIQWHEFDVSYMRKKLLGLSVRKDYTFKPKLDAVSMATMTSSIIFNSIRELESVLDALRRKKHT